MSDPMRDKLPNIAIISFCAMFPLMGLVKSCELVLTSTPRGPFSPTAGRIACCYLQDSSVPVRPMGDNPSPSTPGNLTLVGLRHGMADVPMGTYKTAAEALEVMTRLRCQSCAIPAPTKATADAGP